MGWDDEETVLHRSKLKWLQEQTTARRTAKQRSTRWQFWRQLYGLVLKNLRVRAGGGGGLHVLLHLLTVALLPALAIGVLALIDRARNVPPVIEPELGDFFSLGLSTSASLSCAVFEARRGSAISGAWCAPLLFAPARNAAVRELMTALAAEHDWTVSRPDADGAAAGAVPDGCGRQRCLLGFETWAALSDWLKAHPGRAAMAVVFVDDAAAAAGTLADLPGDALPAAVAYELWFNASALPLYALDGADALAGFNQTSALLAQAQHAVELALSRARLGAAASRVHFRRYPRLRTVRFVETQRYYGLFAINVPIALHAAGLLVQVVAERELGVLGSLRTLGLNDGAYWLSWALQHAAESVVLALSVYYAGALAQLSMFARTEPAVWLTALWLFSMAAGSTACLGSVLFSRRAAAVWAGGAGVVVAGLVALSPSYFVDRLEPTLALLQDPHLLPRLNVGVLELAYPPFAFLKFLFDVTERTQRTAQPDPLSGLTTYQPSGSFAWADLSARGPTDRYASVRAGETYGLQPAVVSLQWLAARVVLTYALVWWLGQLLTGGHGRPREPLFFLNPSFWWPARALRGNAPLRNALRLKALEYDARRLDDIDVAAEAYAVLGGNLPDEKPVVFYDVAKTFRGGRQALRGLSLSLQEHELFALLGRNGAGKTTLVNILTTKLRLSRGDVLLYGASVEHDTDAVRRMVGLCPQADALFPALSADHHLFLHGRFHGLHRRELRDKVPRSLAEVNLLEVRHKRVATFSAGMRRRLSIALAYIGEPMMMALDEPTSGMDPYNRKRVWDLISSAKLHGRTTLLTTHSMEEAEVLAHAVGILREGQLIALGSTPHLKRRFGAGYTIKLVSRRADLPALQAKVAELLPTAECVDASGHSCSYAVSEEGMSRAGKLLRYIEQLKRESDDYFNRQQNLHAHAHAHAHAYARAPTEHTEGADDWAALGAGLRARGERGLAELGELVERYTGPAAPSRPPDAAAAARAAVGARGRRRSRAAGDEAPPPIVLRDWLVAHTSLEEVFMRLARQSADVDDALEAENASAAAAEPATAAAAAAAALASPTSPASAPPAAAERTAAAVELTTQAAETLFGRRQTRQLRAAALKNVALYRRRPVRQCASACASAALVLLVYFTQLFLVDLPADSLVTQSQALGALLESSCANVSRAFDAACDARASVRDAAACGQCAQPDWTSHTRCCVRQNSSIENGCVLNQCVGVGGAVDLEPPDFGGAECESSAARPRDQQPRPYCVCREGGQRSAALQARLDRTPPCLAYRQQVLREPQAMPVLWVPSNRQPGALDGALSTRALVDDDSPTWLGWRVPVFGFGAAGGAVRSKLLTPTATLLATDVASPLWGSAQTFPAAPAALRAARAAERRLLPSETAQVEALVALEDATGLLARFPRALGRTPFGLSRGQPSVECSAVVAATKCCWSAQLVNVGPFDFDAAMEVCSGLGDMACPDTNPTAADLLRTARGYTPADLAADRNARLEGVSAARRMAVSATVDFRGRPSVCDAVGVPPLCAAVRARANVSAPCEAVRGAREAFLGLVNATNATDASWDEADWEDEASWACVQAACVGYDAYLVPGYTRDEWAGQAELNAHVLAEQAKILANAYAAAADVGAHADAQTRLNAAEFLFPSWSLELTDLNAANGTVEWAVTSFFRRALNGYLYATEPLAGRRGASEYDVRLRDLQRPFALEGRLALAKVMPLLFQNAFTNALLQERLGDDQSVRAGLRPMAEPRLESVPYETSRAIDIFAVCALPVACVLMLPQLAHALVQDKAYKVRVLMSLAGMPQVSYWLVEWAFASLASHAHLLLFWLLGTFVAVLTAFARSRLALLTVLMVWAQLQVGLAMLLSTPFSRTRRAAAASSLFLLGCLASGSTIWALGLEEVDEAPAWAAEYDILPPLAFFHCLWLIIRAQVDAADLFDATAEIYAPFRLLRVHVAWVLPVALYLDAVLPREHGHARSAFFFLQPRHNLTTALALVSWLPGWLPPCGWLKRVATPRLVGALDALDRQAVPARVSLSRKGVAQAIEKDGHAEDDDVRAERVRVERGEYSSDAPVQIFSLHKRFGDRVALHNLTLKVGKDECFGLLGPNGAGKTTTISMLTGLVRPTSGNALVAGHDVLRELPQVSQLVGVCPQHDILWPELTVREHLLFYARVKGVPRAVESAAVYASAANVGLLRVSAHKLHAAVRRLSSGERRRLSLAIALLGSPAVLLLDEPSSGLDPESRRLVWQVIEGARAGRAILLATHATEEADQLCSRLGILANGALRALGSNVHLKNKWGAGYKVDITFMPRAEAALDVFIRAVLPTAELDTRRSWLGNRMYRVRRQDVSLARLFHRMDQRDEATGIIHWGVRQTSLEEIFLLVTADFELAPDGSQRLGRFDRRSRRAAGRALQRVAGWGRRALAAAGAAVGDVVVVAAAPAEADDAPAGASSARAPRSWAPRLPTAVGCFRRDDDDSEPVAADFAPNLDPWPTAAPAAEPPPNNQRQPSPGKTAFRRFFFSAQPRQARADGEDAAFAPERGGRRRRESGGAGPGSRV